MPVVNRTLFITDVVYEGIIKGDYRIDGGVVRIANGKGKGQIVEFLSDANPIVNSPESMGIVHEISKYFLSHKEQIIITVSVASLLYVGYIILKSVNTPNEVKILQEKLNIYIECIEKNKLTITEIKDLEQALINVIKLDNYEDYSINLTASQLKIIINHMSNLTHLQEDVAGKLGKKYIKTSGCIFTDLRDYLSEEKKMYK